MKSKEPAKVRVVIDSSVLVAALLSESGGSAKIIELVLTGKLYNFYTTDILGEVDNVLKRVKFNLEKEKREHFLHIFRESSFLVTPLPEFKITRCRDKEDDKFLSLALQVEANYIVSLDKDLTELGEFKGVKIVNPGIFLKS